MTLEAFQLKGKNALVTGSHKGWRCHSVACKGWRQRRLPRRDPNPGSPATRFAAPARHSTFRRIWRMRSASLSSKKQSRSWLRRILVNNAGMIRRAPAAEYPAEFWNELIAVNLTAVFLLSQLVARHMLQRGAAAKS